MKTTIAISLLAAVAVIVLLHKPWQPAIRVEQTAHTKPYDPYDQFDAKPTTTPPLASNSAIKPLELHQKKTSSPTWTPPEVEEAQQTLELDQKKTNLTGGKFISHSRTVEAYRVLYPQLTNLTDERLVLAIGTKHPEFLKTDNVLSNEFALSSKNPYAQFVTAEPTAAEPNVNRSILESPITNITTLDGETYTGVKIKKVDPDGLVISYSNGQPGVFISKVHFDNLPDSIRERFHYDPNQAVHFQQLQSQTMEELRQRLTVDDQIAVSAENQRIAEGLTQRQIEQDQKIAAQAAEAQQRMAEAEQKQADAAMIQALQPPPSVNMIQENNTYGW